MRKNQSSLTAAGIAIARAEESEKPANERLISPARMLGVKWLAATGL